MKNILKNISKILPAKTYLVPGNSEEDFLVAMDLLQEGNLDKLKLIGYSSFTSEVGTVWLPKMVNEVSQIVNKNSSNHFYYLNHRAVLKVIKIYFGGRSMIQAKKQEFSSTFKIKRPVFISRREAFSQHMNKSGIYAIWRADNILECQAKYVFVNRIKYERVAQTRYLEL